MMDKNKYSCFQVRFRLRYCLYLKDSIEMWNGIDMSNKLGIHILITTKELEDSTLSDEKINQFKIDEEFSTLQLIDKIKHFNYYVYIYGWLSSQYKSLFYIFYEQIEERNKITTFLKNKINRLGDLNSVFFLHPSVFYFDNRKEIDNFIFLPFFKSNQLKEEDMFKKLANNFNSFI